MYHRTRGEYVQVINLLTGAPHAVVDAIAVKDESKRPAEGIKSRKFAYEVQQLLLWAYQKTP